MESERRVAGRKLKSATLSVRITAEQREILEAIAAEQGSALVDYVRFVLMEEIRRYKAEEQKNLANNIK